MNAILWNPWHRHPIKFVIYVTSHAESEQNSIGT